MESLCSYININKNDIRKSFIKINNEYVLQHLNINKDSKILLLLPHCIQNSKCEIRLAPDLKNCKNCGKCLIGVTKDICLKHNFYTIIASGGTVARKYVKELKPDFIIAIACERDLTSGIQDCFPIPVFGILNIRNFGPCVNTSYSLPLLTLFLENI
ncbi:MAG: DUF116 domain-containing protein [Desulfovibrio sp.]|nr:DUF116 domain-containing protein [Desulfovibrio sp.]